MSSKIQLISNALILIGDLPITSLSGNSRAQTVANNLYDNIVQMEMTKFRWGFARKIAQLSLSVNTPAGNEWDAIYELPADLLFLIKINPRSNYALFGQQVYTNMNGAVYADYIYNAPESEWPVYFQQMIQYRLAMDFAPAIRDSAASMEANAFQYDNASRMARYTDSQQYPVVPLSSAPFVNTRY
jgi:hypothetical protein|tara:strand:- start:153 stop:710 length:558 start_codon:yes stop_codon:yes gene_type:complete